MSYKLVIVEPAETDADGIYGYILTRSAQGAASWYQAFVSCTRRIVQRPLSCSLALENAEFERELRQALFKTRYGRVYRCVFTIVGDEVRILRLRGPGQASLKASDIVEW